MNEHINISDSDSDDEILFVNIDTIEEKQELK